MRAATWGIGLAIGLLVLAAESCGGESSSDNSSKGGTGGKASGGTGGKASGGTSNVGGTPSGGGTSSGGASGSGGIPIAGAGGLDGGGFDGPTLTDAGYFDCGGCQCDGTTHYCLSISGGALIPPQPDAAICPELDASLASGCQPLPKKCGSTPSCDCIDSPFPGICQCSDVGGGLEVFCPFP